MVAAVSVVLSPEQIISSSPASATIGPSIFTTTSSEDGDKFPINGEVHQLVDEGYAVASINYRLTSQADRFAPASVTFPAQIHDVKGAVRWLRAHADEYCIDPTRVGVWGHSAGGHLAALLGVTGGDPELEGDVGGNLEFSSRVRAAVDYAGTTDVLTIESDIVPVSEGGPGSIIFHGSDLSWNAFILGVGDCESAVDCDNDLSFADIVSAFQTVPESDWSSAIAEKIALARALSPSSHVSDDDPPIFVAHGDSDDIVPIGQSDRFAAALSASAVQSTYRVIPGEGHRVFTAPADAPVSQDVYEFFDQNLNLEFFYHAPRNYCFGSENSTGRGARLSWSGDTGFLLGDFMLEVQDLPPSSFGILIMGSGRDQAPFQAGFRCVGAPFTRLQLGQSDESGRVSIPLPFASLPPNPAATSPSAPLLGSSYYFQYWYRDLPDSEGNTSNLTDALDVQVTP
ncbi:MAG: alpha/beta fold hydrolase [Planctomycetota bacterium]